MKKIFALILATAALLVALAGCSKKEEVFTQKEYEADAAQTEEINIDVKNRAVEVSVSKDDKIHIGYSESEKEYYDISVSDNILTMTYAQSKERSDFIGKTANGKITLEIPEKLLTALRISTTSEDISVSSLNVSGDISLSANGGNISFEKLNAGKSITIDVKNGNINGSIIGGWDDYNITCSSKKGESNLPSEKKGGDKALSVTANNGDVNIEFIK